MRACASLLLLFLAGCGGDRVAFDRAAAATQQVEADLAELARQLPGGPLGPLLGGIDRPERSELVLQDLDLGSAGAPGSFEAALAVAIPGPPRRLVRATVRGRVVLGVAAGAPASTPPRLAAVDLSVTGRTEVTTPEPAFVDATAAAGLRDVHHAPDLDVACHLVKGIWPGSGAGAADVDADGDVDLLVLDGRRSILYENDGAARFTDATAARGLEGLIGTGACLADLDGDGDADLLVTNAFGGNRLFENRGGTFADVTAASGTSVSPKGSSAVAADYDGDGRLDLYVCNSGDYYAYLPEPPWNARNGYPNVLFRNEGGLRFVDRAEAAGVDSRGWSLAAAFADIDGDRDQDLYVANDFGLNQLYENRGDGTFREITKAASAGDRGYGMSVTWGDYDGDLDEDLYVSNIESHYAFLLDHADFPLPPIGRLFRFRVIPMMKEMMAGNSLLRNDGGGRFAKVPDAGAAHGGWSWGAFFLDYDGDGRLDLYSPNGMVTGPSPEDAELDFWIDSSARWSEYVKGEAVFELNGRSLHGHQRDALFRGVDGGKFEDVAYLEGADVPGDARGAVRADFDGDGRPDVYVRHVEQPGTLLLNRRPGGGRLALCLRLSSGGSAEGAVVRVAVGGRELLRVVRAHEGYFSSHDPALLVGLGDAAGADAVAVTWPSGRVDRTGPVPAGSRIDWREGSGPTLRPLRP